MTTDTSMPRPMSLQRLTYHSVLAGLTPIIPLPFADDWTFNLVRKRLVAELARNHDVVLDEESIELLAVGEQRWSTGGCLEKVLVGCVFRIGVYLVRKLFRKIVVFLMVKDCADAFSRCFHEGYLLRHAFATGAIPTADPQLRRVRAAVEAVCLEVDTRPVRQLAKSSFRGSWALISRAARELGRLIHPLRRHRRKGEATAWQQAPLESEEPLLRGLVADLATALAHDEAHLRELEQRLDRYLTSPPRT